MRYAQLLAAGLLFCAASCTQKEGATTSQKFIDPSNFDTTVKPGDNFWEYVNGGWNKRTVISATETSAGGFTDVYNATKAHLKSLIDSVSAKEHPAGSVEQKVGDLYASGMDSMTIQKLGYEPVKPYLQKIDAFTDYKGVLAYETHIQQENGNGLFQFGIGADDKNSTKNILALSQGGLGLPDRDYYLKPDAANAKVIAAYQAYGAKLFQLTGDDAATAAKKMASVYALEKEMAQNHKTTVELRDPQANYHKMAVSEVDKAMPNLGFSAMLSALGIKADSVIVRQPAYYTEVNKLLPATPIDTWKNYYKFHTLNDAANLLDSSFVNARFEYVGKALNGQMKQKPRWDRMLRVVDGNLGEALGKLYVDRYFPDAAKSRMKELVENLSKSFENRIDRLDWMSDSTKRVAKDKLHAFIRKIGFPDKWRDYGKVDIKRNDYFGNIKSAARNEFAYQVSKIGKSVDRTEWGMTPPTINAYYNPTFNEIVFPAGILQPPFFDANADDAINYGGIGMVIGHEMTHAFDDQGAQYDKEGNLKNWWSKGDETKFKEKARSVVTLYNGFTILDTVHVNGSLTTGENMADIGGIAIAYDAFKMTAQGKGNEKIDGFTPDQRFFINFAQIWREKLKPEAARMYINLDPHSPAMHRVNGPLENFTPFYNAFNVQPGQKMYKPENERIHIW